MKRYPIWSYLSISAMDAPVISIAWYLYFVEKSTGSSSNIQNCLILGFSVWLGYMADRLFDIRCKKDAQFISLRHQFCKKHASGLWILWAIILILTAIFSFLTLNSDKIFVGFALIIFILLYNFFNQYFSQRKFPKEICVAVLFAYGTLFLLESAVKIDDLAHFTLICFLNCLILTHKDKPVDHQMGVNSWTHSLSHRSITIIMIALCIYFLIALQGIMNPFFITCLVCIVLHTVSHRFNEEQFRTTLESLYTLIPLLGLICLI